MAQSSSAYLPQPFLDMTGEARPASLSLGSFIASCRRPLRRSLRVNTLKITVSDFLTMVKPYG